MTAGVRGGGFVMGAVGGLALALLLIGAVSYLPHANTASQALYSPAKDAGQGASAASATTYAAATTTSAGVAYVPASQTTSTIAGPQAGGAQAPASSTTVGPGASTPTTTAKANASSANTPSLQSAAGAAGGGLQRPNSLLTVLPGESVGNLITTLSPLLVGLLVAVLIYTAYSRRQDSSS
jgi:hypothetical protein